MLIKLWIFTSSRKVPKFTSYLSHLPMQIRCIQQQATIVQPILWLLFHYGHYHYSLLSLTIERTLHLRVQRPSTINQFVLIISISATSNMDIVDILCVRPQVAAGYYRQQCRKSSFISVTIERMLQSATEFINATSTSWTWVQDVSKYNILVLFHCPNRPSPVLLY